MSFFSDMVESTVDTFSSALGLDALGFNVGANVQAIEAEYANVFGAPEHSKVWSIDGQRWDKVYSYRFIVKKTKEDGSKDGPLLNFALPIPPQSMVIKPMIPSLATATFGGVVEEISPVKFWMINMAGTTGTGVSRDDAEQRRKQSERFRDSINTTGLLAGLSAEANALAGTVGGVADEVIGIGTDIAAGANPISALAGGVTGALNTALLPPLPYSGSGVNGKFNGFTEMHEMVKFFYFYQALKSRAPDKYELHFVNFKTDQSWRVVLKDIQVQRAASNPNLERYQITLKGWDVKNPKKIDEALEAKDFDRFGPNGDLKEVNPFADPLAMFGQGLDQLNTIGSIFDPTVATA